MGDLYGETVEASSQLDVGERARLVPRVKWKSGAWSLRYRSALSDSDKKSIFQVPRNTIPGIQNFKGEHRPHSGRRGSSRRQCACVM